MPIDQSAVDTARTQSQQAQQRLSSETAATSSLPDMLREALNKKFSTDNPLIKERESALTGYMNATTQAPLNVTPKSAGGNADVVYNPAQQANLIQQYRSPFVSRLATLNDLIGLNTGGINNIIDSTSRAAQANLQGVSNNVAMARQNYSDLLGEKQNSDQSALEWYKATHPSSAAAGPDLSFLAPLLASLGMQRPSEASSGPTEAQPQYSPQSGGNSYSPQGQWIFMGNSWIPVVD